MDDEDKPQPGAAKPLPTVGEGCVRRYDPDALSDEHGTAFDGAEDLWQRTQREQQSTDK